jgi:sec-independent protein translocase protein TatA
MPFGPWELTIVLLIVIVIFGAGRLSELGGALGRGIREFRASSQVGQPGTQAAVQPTSDRHDIGA